MFVFMGSLGAGKIILFDVIVGCKNIGFIFGDIKLNGYNVKKEIFVCLIVYCE